MPLQSDWIEFDPSAGLLRISGEYKMVNLWRVCDYTRAFDGPRLIIDLTHCTKSHANIMVPTVAYFRWLSATRGVTVRVTRPADPRAYADFFHAGWLTGLAGDQVFTSPVGPRHVRYGMASYHDPRTAYDVIESYMTGFSLPNAGSATGTAIVNLIRRGMFEMLDNVNQHAESVTGGWTQIADYPHRNRFHIVVADCGRGLRASIQTNPKYSSVVSDDADAIELCVQQGVSRALDSGNAGHGLWEALRMSGRAGGMMKIISHAGEIEWKGTADESPGVRHPGYNNAHFYPGTIVDIQIHYGHPAVIDYARSVLDE